jgi:hypothetical protein
MCAPVWTASRHKYGTNRQVAWPRRFPVSPSTWILRHWLGRPLHYHIESNEVGWIGVLCIDHRKEPDSSVVRLSPWLRQTVKTLFLFYSRHRSPTQVSAKARRKRLSLS